MALTNQKVKHRSSGIGTIIAQDKTSVTVKFQETTSIFRFPDAFQNAILEAADLAGYKAILEEVKGTNSYARFPQSLCELNVHTYKPQDTKAVNNTTACESWHLTGTRSEQMTTVYNEAWAYLKMILPQKVRDEKELKKYFTPKKYNDLKEITKVMFGSMTERTMASNVIGFFRDNRKDTFERILLNYDSHEILERYTAETLFRGFCSIFEVKNANSPSNLWLQYAKSIISFCEYIDKFKTAEAFDEFVCSFKNREIDLPLHLAKEIHGLGFALSCNFLKDIGYVNYPKPDSHIMYIFSAFGFCRKNDDIDAFHAVREMATIVGDTAFNIDRLFWLIGSGNFYEHKYEIGSHQDKFIKMIKAKGF